MQVRIHALWAILLIWAGASFASAQSRSTNDLVAPDSAALLAGGGPSFGWLHVVNAPLTLEEAMTIMPVQHGGYANAVKSTVISVEFDYGVVNRPGVDFAIIDGQYDVGNYRLTTDYDGFTSQVIVNMATGSSIGTETYFYGVTGSTTSADVVSLEVDLASFAIPPGAVVHELRFETLDNQCDPIGLARMHDGFWMGVTQLDAGLKGGVQTCGGTPGGAGGGGLLADRTGSVEPQRRGLWRAFGRAVDADYDPGHGDE